MRQILTITALTTLSFGAAPALAQAIDPAAAVESFLTNTELLGADTATVGAIRDEDGVVVATDVAMAWELAIEVPDGRSDITLNITMPEVRVDGLEATADGHRAAAIQMPSANMVFSVQPPGEERGSYELTVDNYSFKDVSWGAFPVIGPDPDKPLSRFSPLLDWAAAFSYEETAATSVKGVFDVDGERQEASYENLVFGPVVDGKLDSYEYGPVTITQQMSELDPDGTPIDIDLDVEYGIIRGEGLDMKPMIALLTGTAPEPGPQSVIEKLTIDGMNVTGGDLLAIAIGPVTMDAFTIDASGGGILARLDPIAINALNGDEPNPFELVGLMLDIYGAFGVANYAVDGVVVKAEDVNVDLNRVAIEGFSKNGIDLFAVEGLNVQSDDLEMTLGTFTQADYGFPSREAFIKVMLESMTSASPSPRTVLDAIPTLGEMIVSDLMVKPDDLSSPVVVDRASVTMSDFIAPIPTNIAISVKGFSMPLELVEEEQARAALAGMAADPVRVDGDINLRWDEDTRRLEFDNDVAVANVGELRADAILSGIDRAVFENPMAAQNAIATAALNGLSARFTNLGLADFLITMMSQQTGVSPEDFAGAMATQAQLQVSMLTGSQELAQSVSNAVRTFLSNPQTLSISADPAEPLNFAEIIGTAMTAPNALPNMLNFAISAND